MKGAQPKQVTGNYLGWRPSVNLFTYQRDQTICAQLNYSPDNMTEVSHDLLREVGGKGGLGLTAWMPLSALERAKEYYAERGCDVHVMAQPDGKLALGSLASPDNEGEAIMMTSKEIAEHTRRSAARWSVNLPRATVEDRIVHALHHDIADRLGLRLAWEKVSDEVKAEILETWREIIRQELSAGEAS